MHPTSIPEKSPEKTRPLTADNMKLVVSNESNYEKLLASFDHESDLSVGGSVGMEKEDDEISYDNDGEPKDLIESNDGNDCHNVEARDEIITINETTDQNAPWSNDNQKENDNDNMSELVSSNQSGKEQPIVKRVDSFHVDVTFPLECKPDQYFEILHDDELKRIKVPNGQEGKTVRIKLIRLHA